LLNLWKDEPMPLSDQDREQLCQLAIAAMSQAYAPYSGYQVGAAALMDSGRTYAGCNVENASYGLTICAERVAVANAVSYGERKLRAVAIATRDAGSPCGACRQVLSEFAEGSLEVFLVNAAGQLVARLTLDELLPHRFSLKMGE
jgi:cytidine deaminase